jgi:anti-sigma B factor antagonist
MTTPLTLTTNRQPDGRQVLTADGEIDMSNAAQLRDALAQTGAGPVVVDLTAVGYLDSAGLTVLFTHADHIELVVNSLLAPVLTISGLATIAAVRGGESTAQLPGPSAAQCDSRLTTFPLAPRRKSRSAPSSAPWTLFT